MHRTLETARLLDEALAAMTGPGGDVWTAISRLSARADAPGLLVDRYRHAQPAELRWALVFVAANMGRVGVIPLLIEASVRAETDNGVEGSAARLAAEALVNLVDQTP
jgi:hypothetical protein